MADQHNSNIPAMGNQISADIPDIKENLEYHKDAFQRIIKTWSDTDASGLDFSTTPTFNNDDVAIAWPTNNMGSGTPKIMVGDSNTIMWMYLNTAPPGWKALSTGADTVLAVAGGTGDYNVNGGNPDSTASWEIDGLTMDSDTHFHQWLDRKTGNDETGNSSGAATDLTSGSSDGSIGIKATSSETQINADCYTIADTHDHTISSDSTYRPSASVGKLFQLDTA